MPSAAISKTDMIVLRTEALRIAASFYSDNLVPDTAELWRLANFFERAIVEGTEALRADFAPKDAKVPGTVLKLTSKWDVV